MTNVETAQGFANIEGYRVNITVRQDPIASTYLKVLTEKTIKLWLYVAKLYTTGERNAPYNISPEQAVSAAEKPPIDFLPLVEPRCTVWGDPIKDEGFTVHSHSVPQDALDMLWARHDAIAAFAPQNSPQATPAPKTPENANSTVSGNTGGQNPAPLAGVINATRAPNPKIIEYAADQMVAFGVNKVAMGANKGSATYALWGSLGQKYPLMTIYKNKPNSDENAPNYIAIKDFIIGLGLSVDAGKVEANGNWTLICKAAHVPQADGSKKEYLNVVSMAAVQNTAAA